MFRGTGSRIVVLFSAKSVVVVLFILFSLIASTLALTLGEKTFGQGAEAYTHYNNYIIFKQSFFHLINGQDLYAHYPKEHWDLYKYSPTFALFFAVFAILPDSIGLNLWNLANALLLLASVYFLPLLNIREKGAVLMFVMVELMTSMQNSQSNALIAGLIILSFGLLERKHLFWASGCILLSAYIKLFGVVALALFLLHPERIRLYTYAAVWAVLLFVIPLLAVSPEQLGFLYRSWGDLLTKDHTMSYGYSVMGWLHSWFALEPDKLVVLMIGASIFMVPFAHWRVFSHPHFRFLALSSVLLWVVIFNHKAESPTFVIAMVGAALWFMASEKSMKNKLLIVVAVVFTSLSSTDLFPNSLQNELVEPYVLKAVPCILIWTRVIWQMLSFNPISVEHVSLPGKSQ